MKIGWMTALTYEVREGLGLDHFRGLLEEMAREGFNTLHVYMVSEGYHDPRHKGLAWPARNPKLMPLVDKDAINASEETEFLSILISEARAMGIDVYLMTQYALLEEIRLTYPKIWLMLNPDGTGYGHPGFYCHDCDDLQEYALDALRDLLERYVPCGLKGVEMEWPGYSGKEMTCYCPATKERFREDLGKEIEEASREELVAWKNRRILLRLSELVETAKGFGVEFNFHTGLWAPPSAKVNQEERGHSRDAFLERGQHPAGE